MPKTATAKIEYSIGRVTKVRVIEKRLGDAFKQEADALLPKLEPSVTKFVREQIRFHVRNSATHTELIAQGPLRGHLGVVNPQNAMDQMLNILVKTVNVSFSKARRSGGRIVAKMFISAVPGNFPELLGTIGSFSSNDDFETSKEPTIVPWLQWLLTGGGSNLVKTHRIVLKDGAGRTGQAVMVKPGKWQVPEEHRGTKTNNFVTRALTEQNLEGPMQTFMNKLLNSGKVF